MALFTVTMGVALILLVTQTAVLEAAVSQLPPSMKRIVRGAQDYVIVQPRPRPRRPALDRCPRSAHPPERQIAVDRPIGLDAARRGAGAHIRP